MTPSTRIAKPVGFLASLLEPPGTRVAGLDCGAVRGLPGTQLCKPGSKCVCRETRPHRMLFVLQRAVRRDADDRGVYGDKILGAIGNMLPA